MPAGNAPPRGVTTETDPGVLRRLWAHPGLRRLVSVRMLAQLAEGTSQAALAGIVLFSPEDAADPVGIALGFAVLLLPYSVLGPFAAAALDRWDRRRVLAGACLLRVACLLVIAGGLLAGWAGTGVGLGALLTLALVQAGAHRFVTSGVSAALPDRSPREGLVGLNAALATVGSVVAAAGALVSFGVLALTPTASESVVAAVGVGVAAIACVAAAVVVLGHPPGDLGPRRSHTADGVPPATPPAARDLAAGLWRGAVAAWRAPRVRAALCGVVAHRVVLGVDTLVLVLLLRAGQEQGGGSGVLGFGLVIGAMAGGMALAALVTPWALPRLGLRRLCVLALVALTAVQALVLPQVGPASGTWLLVLGGGLLGLPSQVIKLSADAAMLLDVPSDLRGRVFAVQDMLFNAVFVVALTLAVPVAESGAPAGPLLLAVAGVYALAAVLVALVRGVDRPGG